MENILNLGEPHVDLGQNSFLTHLTHEIKIGNKVIGHAMITLYNFKKSSQQNTAWRWIAPKGSYLSNFKQYLFNPEFSTPVLPDVLMEDVIDSEEIVIIDEITLDPFFQERRLESYILKDLIEIYEQKSDITLLTGHQELAKRMGYSSELAAVMYCQLGFVWIDDHVGAKFKTVPMDELEEIQELVVNIASFS